MPKRLIRFKIPLQQAKADLFLRDPKADFIVILEKKIFPLHKQLLAPSAFFQQLIDAGKKSVTINDHLHIGIFEQILGSFYGIEAAFERHLIIDHILGILALIRCQTLEDQLKNDMRINFEQYGLFNLFYLSRRFGLKEVEDNCLKQLIDQDFQQINYNKYDLFQLSPQLFTFVLKQHQRFKAKRAINGLDGSQIRAVCQEYSKATNSRVNVEQILKYGRDFLKQSLSDSQQRIKTPVRRRNATWHNSHIKQPQDHIVNETNHISSDTKIYSFEQKQNEVMKIRLINSNMQENNNKLAAEIKSVKSSIDKASSKELSSGVDDLDRKLKEFEEKSKNAHKKMEELKNKMMKIKMDEEQSQTSEKEPCIGAGNVTRSWQVANGSKMLPGMAVLQKSKDMNSQDSDF